MVRRISYDGRLLRKNVVELKQHLDRLRVSDETTTFGERDKLLDSFVKQGYLHRQKSGHDQDPANEVTFEYFWGPRAKVEVPEDKMVDFIASVSHLWKYVLF